MDIGQVFLVGLGKIGRGHRTGFFWIGWVGLGIDGVELGDRGWGDGVTSGLMPDGHHFHMDSTKSM